MFSRKDLTKDERKKQKRINKLVDDIKGLEQTHKLLKASLYIQTVKVKKIDPDDYQSQGALRKALDELSIIQREEKEYRAEISSYKAELKKLDPAHPLVQPQQSKQTGKETKHSHKTVLSNEAPKIKSQGPKTSSEPGIEPPAKKIRFEQK